ncbi:hypothetical protein [Antarcticirhabdus aurantiaca]|uniref:Uncharacterized protein n=1 Tax=Antarcticirhabdus aurantiaca TaxID=2606717 RepID=A0ACD4NJC5_9HYPH|nr:hypothetical protein OXU80_18675 [Jeongeuplla avenae]
MAEEIAMLLADFELTCAGEPAWAIRETVVAFVRGRVGNGFTPNAAEFGRELRSLTDPIRGKLGYARKRRKEAEEFERDEAIARQPILPETRAKIEAMLAAAQAKTDAAIARPKTMTIDLHGPSPAARVAAETAARKAARAQTEIGEGRLPAAAKDGIRSGDPND